MSLDTLALVPSLPDALRIRTELARELRASRVAHAAIENWLIFKQTNTTIHFEDKTTKDFLGSDWGEYIELLKDDKRLVDLCRMATPALALLSPVTCALMIGEERKAPYEATPMSRLISNAVVDAITDRGPTTILVNAPPRHGKSTLCSRRVPLWLLLNYPYCFAGLVSYSDVFAMEWSRMVRNDVTDSPGTCGFAVAPDASAASAWQTLPMRGGMWSCGPGGAATGRGSHIQIVDDTTKNAAEGYSHAVQDEIWQFYASTVRTRLMQGGITLHIATRFSEFDLPGRVKAAARAGEIREIVLPAIAAAGDPLGRAEGTALWPAQFPIEALEKTRSEIGAESWAALYCQNPLGASSVGRCYPSFDRNIHIQEMAPPDPNMPVLVSYDFNIDGHILLGQYDRQRPPLLSTDQSWRYSLRVFDELAINDSNTKDITEALGERLLRWFSGCRVKLVISGDATGTRRNSQNENLGGDWAIVRQYFGGRGNFFQATYNVAKSNMSVRASVLQVNGFLRAADNTVRLTVSPRCLELIADLDTVRWKRDSNGRWLDVQDSSNPARTHSVDCLRYMIRTLAGPGGSYGEQPYGVPR
jgi:hypothetical protein